MRTWNFGYENSKKRAKSIYSKIGRIPCPALNNEMVAFNSVGFTHLLRKGRIPRTRNEQKRRFRLIIYIEKIIKNPKAVILYRKKDVKEKVDRYGNKIYIEVEAHFWTFVERIDDCNVKLVIRQLDGGMKHFLSIMGDNVKINNKKIKKIKKPHKK